jgi:hypothetical protein
MTLEDSIHSQRLRVLREAERWAMSVKPVGGMACPARCSIACASGSSSTARMACIPNGGKHGVGARRPFRCRRSAA